MFHLTYVWAELRRRRGRTVLTALGLAVGVALVVAVSALSTGLDRAQGKVLEPLTGVGTDMSVTRPIVVSSNDGGFQGLPDAEREQLREENGGGGGIRLRLGEEGEPGDKFSRDDFVSPTQLSFPASTVGDIDRIDSVAQAAGSLTLQLIHLEGTVPDFDGQERGEFAAPAPAPGGGGEDGPPFDVDTRSVTGIDRASPDLAPVNSGQITDGRWFSTSGKREAVLNSAYAKRTKTEVGDKTKIKGKTYTVVGLAKAPLGGDASDIYIDLGELQTLADRKGRVNAVRARAENNDAVAAIEKAIPGVLEGAEVITAKDLAGRVKGSLNDAQDLADTLGTVLVIVGLGAAVLLAGLLTLGSVAKRTRELGTLKAIGWSRGRVVRQVTGESLATGLLGGVIGAAIGVAALGVVDAIGPTLDATVASAAQSGPGLVRAGGPGGPGGGPGPGGGLFGQGSVTSGSTTVPLDVPLDAGLLLLAIGLALLGGLAAGAMGSLRAARLRPAAALRTVE